MESGASQVAVVVKNPPDNVGDKRDAGSTPGSGRSLGGGHGQLIPVFSPGESHRQRSLVGYSPRVAKSQTLLKWLRTHVHGVRKRIIAKTDVEKLTMVFSSRSFMFPGQTFKVLSIFWINFWVWRMIVSYCHSFACICSVFWCHFLRRLIPTPLYILPFFVIY